MRNLNRFIIEAGTEEKDQNSLDLAKYSSDLMKLSVIALILIFWNIIYQNKILQKKVSQTSPTQPPTQMESWKTYSETVCGNFSFRYPSNWTFASSNKPICDNYFVIFNTGIKTLSPESGITTYGLDFGYSKMSFNAWKNQQPYRNSWSFTQGSLNNYKTYSGSEGDMTSNITTYIESGNDTVYFSTFPYFSENPDPAIIGIYNQILSTFQFTN